MASKQIQEDIQKLKGKAGETDSRISRVEASVSEIEASVSGIKSKLDESGWKALDATQKLFSLQWAIWGFFLALVSLGGFGGFQGYKMLRDKLENELKDSMRKYEGETRHRNQTMTFTYISYAIWKLFDQDKTLAYDQKKQYLEAALGLSRFALGHAEALAILGKDEHDDLITTARANHAYWLAQEADPSDLTKPRPGNREEALQLGKKVISVALKYMKMDGTTHISRWPNWAETYCWVLTRYGDAAQKATAKALIEKVCNDERVDENWKKDIRAEYLTTGTTKEANA